MIDTKIHIIKKIARKLTHSSIFLIGLIIITKISSCAPDPIISEQLFSPYFAMAAEVEKPTYLMGETLSIDLEFTNPTVFGDTLFQYVEVIDQQGNTITSKEWIHINNFDTITVDSYLTSHTPFTNISIANAQLAARQKELIDDAGNAILEDQQGNAISLEWKTVYLHITANREGGSSVTRTVSFNVEKNEIQNINITLDNGLDTGASINAFYNARNGIKYSLSEAAQNDEAIDILYALIKGAELDIPVLASPDNSDAQVAFNNHWPLMSENITRFKNIAAGMTYENIDSTEDLILAYENSADKVGTSFAIVENNKSYAFRLYRVEGDNECNPYGVLRMSLVNNSYKQINIDFKTFEP